MGATPAIAHRRRVGASSRRHCEFLADHHPYSGKRLCSSWYCIGTRAHHPASPPQPPSSIPPGLVAESVSTDQTTIARSLLISVRAYCPSTREYLARLARRRKNKASNQDWVNS